MNAIQFHEHIIENYQKHILNKLEDIRCGMPDFEAGHLPKEVPVGGWIRDTKTYAESLLKDTWNMLDSIHMIGFSDGMVVRGDFKYDSKEQREERKPVKIDEYNTLRKKVVKLGVIK